MSIYGLLHVNLDPPYLGFSAGDTSNGKHSSLEEMRDLLIELEAVEEDHQWPKEYQLRLSGRFPKAKLVKYGLVSEQDYRTH